MPSDKEILKPLVERIVQLAGEPAQEEKKRMWADHQALRRAGVGKARIPVSVYFEGVPDGTWEQILGPGYLQCVDAVARRIESDLRKRIYIAANVPDDHIVFPATFVFARVQSPESWGVPLEREHSRDALGAYKPIAPLADEIDLKRVHFTDEIIDEAATATDRAHAQDLVEGKLDVHTYYINMGYSPFDILVAMRGMEQVMMDSVERPEELAALMDVITSGTQIHHENRARLGHINRFLTSDGKYQMWRGERVHCCHVLGAASAKPDLTHEWAYISAQTSAGFGPPQFQEFVHPFNCRLASYFTKNTVYYHGCETLDQKMGILAKLPNLRRFHVSPWSTVSAAVAQFGDRAVLEVHAHPGKVFFGGTEESIRAELRQLVSAAKGAIIDLNLSDIHTVNKRPDLLGLWARVAQELAAP